MRKFYVIAGEASGDLHGANLIKAMRELAPDSEFRCWGGDRMEAAGADLVKHYRDLAFMGFIEVLFNLRTILGNIKFCKQDIDDYAPDALILIDYPGFNLRIAEYAHAKGIPVFYYISPQVWAWKKNRVHKINKVVDKLFVILPFEKEFYAKYGYEAEFVGHPLLDEITPEKMPEDFRTKNQLSDNPILALFPGSRKQEIDRILPIMLESAREFPDHQVLIAAAPSQDDSAYLHHIKDRDRVKILRDQSYEIMSAAEAGAVTSGTATLESALHGMPEVVCYKGNAISYWIARMLVKVKFISLVNLIMDREIVTELIQGELTANSLKNELDELISGKGALLLQGPYQELRQKLGGKGASHNTAKSLLKTLEDLSAGKK